MANNIVILNFSPRKGGNCRQISDFIAEKYNRTNVLRFDISGEDFAPCRNCNYECLTPGVSCPAVTDHQREVMDAVCESQITYYIIPNFCGYPCSNYFAYNERSVGYFNMDRALMGRYMAAPKKFILVSNTENDNFLNAVKQQTKEDPQVLYLKTSKYGKRSTAGDLMTSEEAKADLQAFLG